jgi:hypothetical protein
VDILADGWDSDRCRCREKIGQEDGKEMGRGADEEKIGNKVGKEMRRRDL